MRPALAVGLAFAVAAFAVRAEPQPAPLIAVVDVQRVVHESAAGKSLDAQYEKQHQQFVDAVAAKERDLDAREDELKRQRTVLTTDSFNAQREALETYAAGVQKGIQQESQDDQLAFNDAFAQVVKTVREIVAAIAKEKNVAVVLPLEQTLYTGEGTIDITDSVLSRLDAKLPTISVTPPAGPTPKPAPSRGETPTR